MSQIEMLEEDIQVLDESEKDKTVKPTIYNISNYGADYDVAGLVARLRKGDIAIPSFQRAYVWKEEDASAFIESLLLGLPVPGIFLATEKDTNKMLVIDGQQRLRTLLFFYDGFFDPKPDEKKKRVFRLIDVQPQFEGKTYQELNEKDRRKLDDSLIHATIIKQESPQDGNTSIYHIFHRLNSGGVILKPQEIRRAAFHGNMMDLISELNNYSPWRKIFGPKNKRLKDEELILRFLALYFSSDEYAKPMEEFLNTFASTNTKAAPHFLERCRDIFQQTIDAVAQSLGDKPFRIFRVINAAVFDSVMYGIAKRLEMGSIKDYSALSKQYHALIKNEAFVKSVTDGTSDEATVQFRLRTAAEQFAHVQ